MVCHLAVVGVVVVAVAACWPLETEPSSLLFLQISQNLSTVLNVGCCCCGYKLQYGSCPTATSCELPFHLSSSAGLPWSYPSATYALLCCCCCCCCRFCCCLLLLLLL
ncbi:unnamed protein product [Polarella glacialis]|uniref:Secreted protein n=1 Tax=Polarella glacialis TaxID=89957 RepID=A0A813EMK6_POLGL|nr:unnamed protein product [Polarella glacialis]